MIMNNDEFIKLRDFIKDKCGLFYDFNKKYVLENRLQSRIKVLGLQGYLEYLEYLNKNLNKVHELEKMFELLTTNETYFFREMGQINVVLDELIPELETKNQKNIKIWSSASSSGEEAYTIVMSLLEKRLYDKMSFEILASDINSVILEYARNGIYTDFSFRKTSQEIINKYFSKKNNMYEISSDIKNKVKFMKFNLMDFDNYFRFTNCDIIFCRNVLIYFNEETVQKVVDKMYDCLKPGGVLFLGHSESLYKYKVKFKLHSFKTGLGYVK